MGAVTMPLEARLTRSGRSVPQESADAFSDAVLRAKYLDYCSARVADLLLRLTADEMYLLAQDATRELAGEDESALSYTEIVRLATDRISTKLALPDFHSWAADYRRDPEAFDRELIGLWETDFKASDRGGGH